MLRQTEWEENPSARDEFLEDVADRSATEIALWRTATICYTQRVTTCVNSTAQA
jgi:hypothetical protein